MKLLDLAKRCGATIQEVARTIDVQFKDSLPVSASTHVPDDYISRICTMYGVPKTTAKRSSFQELKPVNKSMAQPAKTFGSGEGKAIRLNVIAKDLNIGLQTISEAFEYIFQGNTNPNSRVTPDLAKRIYNAFGKEFVASQSKDFQNNTNSKSTSKDESIGTGVSGKALLKFLKDAVNKKCLMATVLGHNTEKGVYFVDLLGFRSLLYESEVKGNTPLNEHDEITVVPTKVYGKNQPEYVLVSMKRVDKVRNYEQRRISKQQRKEQEELEFNQLEINSKIYGTISEVSDNYVIVEFGFLHGIIFKKNLFWGNICRIDRYFSIGTQIEAKVIYKEKEENRYNIRLSHKDCIPNIWEQIELDTTESGSNEIEEAEVVEVQDGGLIISLGNGFEGFLPIGEMSYGDYKYYLDHEEEATLIDVFVKAFDPKKKSIIFTRQPYYDDDWENIDNEFLVDEIYNGKILRANEEGLLVELREDIEAFVPQKELFWQRTKQDVSLFAVESEIYIQIKNIDKNRRRIIGSVKDVIPDPWVINESAYGKSQTIQVKSIQNKKDGIVIETVDGGLIGRIPYSEISWLYSTSELPNSEIPNVGDVFDAKIIVWNPEKRILRLSIRELEDNPWSNIIIGAKVSGTVNVRSHSKGGFIINLDCGLDAITYEKKSDMVIGSKVDFKVVDFDKNKRVIVVSNTRLIHDEKTDGLVRNFFL